MQLVMLYVGKSIHTLSILLPTSIFTMSFRVVYVSSSFSQFSNLVKVSLLVTSYTGTNRTTANTLEPTEQLVPHWNQQNNWYHTGTNGTTGNTLEQTVTHWNQQNNW